MPELGENFVVFSAKLSRAFRITGRDPNPPVVNGRNCASHSVNGPRTRGLLVRIGTEAGNPRNPGATWPVLYGWQVSGRPRRRSPGPRYSRAAGQTLAQLRARPPLRPKGSALRPRNGRIIGTRCR